MKKGYIIVRLAVTDSDLFQKYPPLSSTAMEKYGGKYLVRAPGAIALEGIDAENNSVVISEWPSKEAAQSFWNSDEYQEIKKLREGIAECYVLLIESNDLS